MLLFLCSYPYGKAKYKYIEAYGSTYGDPQEWANASGILTKNEYQGTVRYDTFYTSAELGVTNSCAVYNPGDTESPLNFKFTINSNNKPTQPIILGYYEGNTRKQVICLNPERFENDATITIDSKTKLISHQHGKITMMNDCILAGDFITIPIIRNKTIQNHTLRINTVTGMSNFVINYPYLYI